MAAAPPDDDPETLEKKKAEKMAEAAAKKSDDLTNSPKFLERKVASLKKEILSAEKEIVAAEEEVKMEWAEWGGQIERTRFEFSQLKTRMLNETIRASDAAKVSLLKEVVAVMENFDRANNIVKPQTDGEREVVEYYKVVYDTINELFVELGCIEVETVGAPFDYNMHEAVMRIPDPNVPEDHVLQCLQKGYLVGDTLIRPAMVAVSAGP